MSWVSFQDFFRVTSICDKLGACILEKELLSHTLKLIDQVTSDIQKTTEYLATKPEVAFEECSWVVTIEASAILLRCLNIAFLTNKRISKVYALTNSDTTLYGVPVASHDNDRYFDFLVLEGNGYVDSGITTQIKKSDNVRVWHTFRSVS